MGWIKEGVLGMARIKSGKKRSDEDIPHVYPWEIEEVLVRAGYCRKRPRYVREGIEEPAQPIVMGSAAWTDLLEECSPPVAMRTLLLVKYLASLPGVGLERGDGLYMVHFPPIDDAVLWAAADSRVEVSQAEFDKDSFEAVRAYWAKAPFIDLGGKERRI